MRGMVVAGAPQRRPCSFVNRGFTRWCWCLTALVQHAAEYKPIAELIDQWFREPIDRQNKDYVKPRFKGLRALTDGLNRDT